MPHTPTRTSVRNWVRILTCLDPGHQCTAFVRFALESAGCFLLEASNYPLAYELALQLPELDLLVAHTEIGCKRVPHFFQTLDHRLPVLYLEVNPGMGPHHGATLEEPFTAEQLLTAVRGQLLFGGQAGRLV